MKTSSRFPVHCIDDLKLMRLSLIQNVVNFEQFLAHFNGLWRN